MDMLVVLSAERESWSGIDRRRNDRANDWDTGLDLSFDVFVSVNSQRATPTSLTLIN